MKEAIIDLRLSSPRM